MRNKPALVHLEYKDPSIFVDADFDVVMRCVEAHRDQFYLRLQIAAQILCLVFILVMTYFSTIIAYLAFVVFVMNIFVNFLFTPLTKPKFHSEFAKGAHLRKMELQLSIGALQGWRILYERSQLTGTPLSIGQVFQFGEQLQFSQIARQACNDQARIYSQ